MKETKQKTNSIVWKFFIKRSDGLHAECKLCHQSIKSSGNTTNLHSHLNFKHRSVIESNVKRPAVETNSTENEVPLKKRRDDNCGKMFLSSSQDKSLSKKQLRIDNLFLDQNSYNGKIYK